MKRAIQLAASLYPLAWRRRYGEEFDALIDDHKPGWREFTDVLRGALQMQMTNAASYLKLAGGLGIVGAIVAMAVSFNAPSQYVSTAVMRVTPRTIDASKTPQGDVSHLEEINQEILSRTSLESLIMSPALRLYKEERKRLPMSDIVQLMRQRDLRIYTLDQPGVFAISFSYPDRQKAQAAVRELVTKFTESEMTVQRTQARLFQSIWPQYPPPAADGVVGEVLDPPTMPERPVSPNLAAYAALGLAGGLLVGLAAAAAIHKPKWTLQVAGIGIACCVLAFAISLRLPETYTSTCVMRMMPPEVPEKPDGDVAATPPAIWLERMEAQALSDASLQAIVQGENLVLSLEGMRKDLRVERLAPLHGPSENERAFAISFTYPDPHEAQAVVRDLVTRFVERRYSEARARVLASGNPKLIEIEEHKDGENLEVLDPPSDPQRPAGPNRLDISLVGLAAGLLLGVVTLFTRRNPTLQPA